MTSESLRTVRDRFSEFIERVNAHHERVVITRNGSPAAVGCGALADQFERLLTKAPMPGTVKATRPRPGA